jgi:hypothetical protein
VINQPPVPRPIRVFLSYAHRDEALVEEFRSHLAILRRRGMVAEWYDRRIAAGGDWNHKISAALEEADLILLLLSADFLASDYIFDVEVQRAMQKQQEGKARIVPIILRPVLWEATPFSVFQALPRDARPVTSWRNRDEAWFDVMQGITLICEEMIATPQPLLKPRPDGSEETFPLFDVFKASGMPIVTFVEPDAFPRLKLSIAQPGRGVVIQGPSGIGKTTALRKALDEVQAMFGSQPIQLLSARRRTDAKRLEDVESWHNGVVAVDDFHRLDPSTQAYLADYLKDLADRELPDRKLIIVGIPQTGQVLVDLAFDLSTRIDVFTLGKVRDDSVLRMIETGERALNIEFNRKTDIARAASGSLNIAQLLCFHLAATSGVSGTQDTRKKIESEVRTAVSGVLQQLSLKFGTLVRTFASLGNKRDTTCIEILQELARTEDGFLSLPYLRDARPDLGPGIERFIKNDYMAVLYQKLPASEQHLLFDRTVPALIIDDPQLTFFLLQTPPSSLLKSAGKIHGAARSRVFISYSRSDSKWLERIRIHLKPLEREGRIDLWDDTKIEAGAVWRDDIAKALDMAKVAVLLVTADFLASEFIVENELPPLLAAAAKDGLVIIPVIVSPSRYANTEELGKFQAINPPSRPLSAMSKSEQEALLVKVSTVIEDALGD